MNSSRVKTEKKGQQNVSKCNVDWNYAHPLQISKNAPEVFELTITSWCSRGSRFSYKQKRKDFMNKGGYKHSSGIRAQCYVLSRFKNLKQLHLSTKCKNLNPKTNMSG